jgi:hypothetical protein
MRLSYVYHENRPFSCDLRVNLRYNVGDYASTPGGASIGAANDGVVDHYSILMTSICIRSSLAIRQRERKSWSYMQRRIIIHFFGLMFCNLSCVLTTLTLLDQSQVLTYVEGVKRDLPFFYSFNHDKLEFAKEKPVDYTN